MSDWGRPRADASAEALPLFSAITQAVPVDTQTWTRANGRVQRRASTSTSDGARLLTVDDVCNRLQCGRTYVYALLQKGTLRAVKLGRLTRIPLAELEEFIAHKVADAPYDVCERWSRGGDRAAL
jgi:excisionase family DNA binding protein